MTQTVKLIRTILEKIDDVFGKALHNVGLMTGNGFTGYEWTMDGNRLPFSSSANNNKDPILNFFKNYDNFMMNSNDYGLFFEIGSGTGQHLEHLSSNLSKNIIYQPSDHEINHFGNIAKRCQNNINVLYPCVLNLMENNFDKQIQLMNDTQRTINKTFKWKCIYLANVTHISPFKCTEGIFRFGQQFLDYNEMIYIYGPFIVDGYCTDSNKQFSERLKQRNNEWGVRELRDIEKFAKKYEFELIHTEDMPKNNKIIVFRKESILINIMYEYIRNTEKGSLKDMTKDIDDNAICYGLKGRENYTKGMQHHLDTYPDLSYVVLETRIGKDNIGKWTEFDFIRKWKDPNTNNNMEWNSADTQPIINE